MTQGEPLTTRVIRDEAGWDAIRAQWDDLYAACPCASTPMDFCWLRGWWAAFGAEYGTGGLRIVTVWRGTDLIAVLPLYVRVASRRHLGVRCLRFISTGEAEHEETCPDYLGLLCLPTDEAACADAVWAEIGRLDWDELELLDLDARSPLVRAGTIPPGVRPVSRGICYIADLTGGFDAYVQRLGSHGRMKARRLLRDGEQADAKFEIVGADGIDGAFDDLVRLHQGRWAALGKPGAFAAPRFVAFHRRLIQEWLPSGRAVLARLSLRGEPVVALYGFVTRQKFDFYQLGMRREPGGPVRSPGNLALLHLMKALAERGVTTFDFLRGSASYKERLAGRETELIAIRTWRPTVRGVASRSVRLAREFVGRHLSARIRTRA